MEMNATEEIKAHLMQTNDQFRELVNKHHEYDLKVEELEHKPVLSAEEELEEHRLKKLKLHVKDEMQHIVSEYRVQHAG